MLRTKMSSWFSYWKVQKTFPDLTGPFAVGCTDYMCSRDDSADFETQASGTFIRLFYPAEISAETKDEANHCFWVPRREYASGMVNFMQFPTVFFGRLLHWTVGSSRIPAVYNAPVFQPSSDNFEGQLLPCVVFSHGLGGNRLIYSAYCCDLASQGCLVACIEHRDESASATFVLNKNGSEAEVTEEWIPYHPLKPSYDLFKFRNGQVHKRVDECILALNILEKIHAGNFPPNLLNDTSILNQLKGRMDSSKTAVMGHSFGGATAVLSLAKDKRFRCGVALDVWMLPLGDEIYDFEIDQPVLFVNTQAFHHWTENMEPLKKLINQKPDTRPIIAIRWTKHMDQCDIPLVLPKYMLRLVAIAGKLDPITSFSLHNQAIWAHVSRHLGIGNPPRHMPIIDGGEGTPKLVIIGPEFIPPTEDLKEITADGDYSHGPQGSNRKRDKGETMKSTENGAKNPPTEIQSCN